MRQIGLQFRISPSRIDESYPEPISPVDLVQRAAYEKARTMTALHPAALVLGADTVVVYREQILRKPRDEEEATAMLWMLSGSVHQVITGVALLQKQTGYEDGWFSTTQVRFRDLTEGEIEWYVGTGEPVDKAGAYGIQGQAASFVIELQGSYTNVVGLPLAELMRQLQQFVSFWSTHPK